MITVKIGPEHTTYHIHKGLLVHHSEYFRRALNGNWLESDDKTVVIDDMEPGPFDTFVDWLYTGKLPWRPFGDGEYATSSKWTMPHEGDETKLTLCLLQIKSYVVADRLGAGKLVKAINNHFIDSYKFQAPWYKTVIYAFDHIPSERPILWFLIDTHCVYWNEDYDKKHHGEEALQDELPHEFLLSVMKRMRSLHVLLPKGASLDENKYYDDGGGCE